MTKPKRVVVIHIKPTQYDNDGYTQRYAYGVLPSNSLAAIYPLTRTASRHCLGDIPCESYMLEDGLMRHARKLKKLRNRFPEAGTKLIVCLVAVQTSQFPRALDLIDEWQGVGAECVIGGFHVSGIITAMLDGIVDEASIPVGKRRNVPCPGIIPDDITELWQRGVRVFHGEAEQIWQQTLEDIIFDGRIKENGRKQLLYRGGRPGLDSAPVPEYAVEYYEKSFATRIGTFDTGRGFPFACNFCVIINVQGRTQRYRKPEAIIAAIKKACAEDLVRNGVKGSATKGRASFFFTDDNFVRNPLWEDILNRLTALRAEGYGINFMVEADLLCWTMCSSDKVPFLKKLADAGGTQIFMGVESMNPKNLADAHKWQNNVKNYEKCWNMCHEFGISVHGGYIIGFNHDTFESVASDIQMLKKIGCDQVSFFILTPLPGSEDHINAYVRGVPMDRDWNNYDSFHTVWDHPGGLMTREVWFDLYQQAWRWFYTMDHMITVLKRFPDRSQRWNLIRNFLWYRWSFETEKTHPMIAGFYRVRQRLERRPGIPITSRWQFAKEEVVRHLYYLKRGLSEVYRAQHVILETESAFGKEWSRRWLNNFWLAYGRQRWHLAWKWWWHLKMIPHAAAEIVYTVKTFVLIRKVFAS